MERFDLKKMERDMRAASASTVVPEDQFERAQHMASELHIQFALWAAGLENDGVPAPMLLLAMAATFASLAHNGVASFDDPESALHSVLNHMADFAFREPDGTFWEADPAVEGHA